MRSGNNRFNSVMNMCFLIAGLITINNFMFAQDIMSDARVRSSSTVQKEEGRNRDLPLDGPYSKNDPRAKLSRKLQNIRAIHRSVRATAGASNGDHQATLGAEYDIRDGREVNETNPGEIDNNRLSNLTSSDLQLRAGTIGSSVVPNHEDLVNEKSQAGGDATNVVIGTDDRQLQNPTNFYPRSAITKLFVTMKNGNEYHCSGTLISSQHVLTAAHCIYSHDDGGWADSVEVVPGLNGDYKPFGSAYSTKLRTYIGWTIFRDTDYDLALITLDRHIGFATGWFGYGYFSSIAGETGRIMGYPLDLSDGLQNYFDYDRITHNTSNKLFHNIDATAGQGGSGIYRIINGDRYVIAVASLDEFDYERGDNINCGTIITSKRYSDLKSWIDSEP